MGSDVERARVCVAERVRQEITIKSIDVAADDRLKVSDSLIDIEMSLDAPERGRRCAPAKPRAGLSAPSPVRVGRHTHVGPGKGSHMSERGVGAGRTRRQQRRGENTFAH